MKIIVSFFVLKEKVKSIHTLDYSDQSFIGLKLEMFSLMEWKHSLF